jgi:FAD/FMN-containing dehydrogenase
MTTETLVYSKTVPEEAIKNLKSDFRGEILVPGNIGYDEARKVWNGMIDRRPALIARALGTSDVMKSVRFARDNGMMVSVKGGGHNVAGNAVCDDGVMIDLSLMKSVRVDTENETARAEPGVTWRQFDLETQQFGLSTTGGLVSSTGIAGFTLGGGIGWLVRKYGLALDNLISVDVVTAEGKLVHASMDNNSDLFWGVRGGGGNFGIVTSFEFKLHPVGPIIFGGLVAYKAEDGADMLKFYREFVRNAPDELTSVVVFLTAPPAPFIPQELHGKHLIAIALCYCGNIEQGEKVVEPIRSFGRSAVNLLQPMPYTVLQSMFDLSAPAGVQNYWKSAYLNELSDDAIDTILAFGNSITSPLSAIHIHQLGGAMRRVGDDATAFGHRDSAFALNIPSCWTEPAEKEKHVKWTREFFAAMQRFTSGAYVNFMSEDDGSRVREAYGESRYSKLVSVKKKYDPTNFFRMNQNISPGTP